MNSKQVEAAREAMIAWLSDPQELGKAPSRIECAGQFDHNDMHYYIFRFKTGAFGKWLVGVSGGFEDDDLEPCGHTYSELKPYQEVTARDDCLGMVKKVIAYWQAQA